MTGALPTLPAAAAFASAAEFREVIERIFELVCCDEQMGPRLRAAETPECFEFPDLGLRFAVRSGGPGERNLVWAWGEAIDWQPKVTLTMTSEVANRFFQGAENVAVALARGRIRLAGDGLAAVALVPLIRPLFARYRDMLEKDYPHLALNRA